MARHKFVERLHVSALQARNRYRWWHRRGKQAMVSIDDPVETADGSVEIQVEAKGNAPDVEVANAEFIQTLSQKMSELPPKFREVLVLRNIENMSYEEISVALECSVGTVKSRIARAREALREAMAGEL